MLSEWEAQTVLIQASTASNINANILPTSYCADTKYEGNHVFTIDI